MPSIFYIFSEKGRFFLAGGWSTLPLKVEFFYDTLKRKHANQKLCNEIQIMLKDKALQQYFLCKSRKVRKFFLNLELPTFVEKGEAAEFKLDFLQVLEIIFPKKYISWRGNTAHIFIGKTYI